MKIGMPLLDMVQDVSPHNHFDRKVTGTDGTTEAGMQFQRLFVSVSRFALEATKWHFSSMLSFVYL